MATINPARVLSVVEREELGVLETVVRNGLVELRGICVF